LLFYKKKEREDYFAQESQGLGEGLEIEGGCLEEDSV